MTSDPTISLILINLFSIILIIARLIFSVKLIEIIILTSGFSILLTLNYLLLDAPDVAMTEAALGVALSSVVLLCFSQIINKYNIKQENISQVKNEEKDTSTNKIIVAAILSIALFAIIIFVTSDYFPIFGEKTALHNHVSKYFLDNTEKDIGIPSFVAAILASYRGFDTFGETLVILIAAIGLLLILPKNSKEKE